MSNLPHQKVCENNQNFSHPPLWVCLDNMISIPQPSDVWFCICHASSATKEVGGMMIVDPITAPWFKMNVSM
jgi:hypothetical protein